MNIHMTIEFMLIVMKELKKLAVMHLFLQDLNLTKIVIL